MSPERQSSSGAIETGLFRIGFYPAGGKAKGPENNGRTAHFFKLYPAIVSGMRAFLRAAPAVQQQVRMHAVVVASHAEVIFENSNP